MMIIDTEDTADDSFDLDALFAESDEDEALREAEREAERLELAQQIADLPDQRLTYQSQKEQYAESAKHRKGMSKAAALGAKLFTEKYRQDNPEAKDLFCRTTSAVTLIPEGAKIDVKGFYQQVLGAIMWRSDELTTQKAILDNLNGRLVQRKQSPNIWTRNIPSWQIKNFTQFIAGNRPEWNVSLAGCTTLGDCRRAMLLAKDGLTKQKSFKANVVFTSKQVIVNKTSYPILHTVSKGITTARVRVTVGKKRTWITVDSLLALLSNAK